MLHLTKANSFSSIIYVKLIVPWRCLITFEECWRTPYVLKSMLNATETREIHYSIEVNLLITQGLGQVEKGINNINGQLKGAESPWEIVKSC